MNCPDSGSPGPGYDVKDPSFMIKDYNNFTKEATFRKGKAVDDMQMTNRLAAPHEIIPSNVSHSVLLRYLAIRCYPILER